MKARTSSIHSFPMGIALSLALLPAVWSLPSEAFNLSGATIDAFTAYPVTTLENVTPKVLLTMSRDHNYYFKAYNDFTDLDGDGVIETTYKNDFQYYGYFDPDKCYQYVFESVASGAGSLNFFKPRAFTKVAGSHYCNGTVNGVNHEVAGEWSGNFLNWAAMTRMDIIRKIAYGGRRWEDKATHTLIERAFLPPDAHAFAKYYNGSDIPNLTPFTTAQFNASDGDGVDETTEGITICNFTYAESGSSQNTNARPLMRIVKGNYALWTAGEVLQCHFSDDPATAVVSATRKNISDAGFGKNYNDPSKSGLNAYGVSPPRTDGLSFGGFGPDWQVHISMCADGLFNTSGTDNEHCRRYPAGNYKPSGLLQEYGEEERIHFGAFTGTYEKNKSGGVLRKHVGPLDDEINFNGNNVAQNDGTFKADPNSAVPAVGIIRALDVFKLHDYDLSVDRKGVEGSRYASCPGGDFAEGDCASWGNPISEIYAEAIRYFAGLEPTPQFDANDATYIGGLDEDEWEEVLTEDNFCAALNIVMINSSVISFDQETSHFGDIGGNPDPIALTGEVGAQEGLDGKFWFYGRDNAPDAAGFDGYCTAKQLDNLGQVAGICPEAPTLDGTYQLAGMAWYARTNDIRTGLTGEQSVTSYMVQLATNTPAIVIDAAAWNAIDKRSTASLAPEQPAFTSQVNILPAYRRLKDRLGVPDDSAGTLSDFKIVEPLHEVTPGKYTAVAYRGKAFVQWDEREQGGDFDQDIWGILSYELYYKDGKWQVEVTTDVIAATAFSAQLFGFTISGTTQDGFHAYSGAYRGNEASGAQFRDRFNVFVAQLPDCNSTPGCNAADAARSHNFTVGAFGAALPPDPLFLAAKYGGFDDSNGNLRPDIQGEYDIRDQNGRKVVGGDGIPDTYFYVTNPAALEDSLRAVFDQIIERVASGTAAAVVASEQEGTGAVYQALYDPIKTDTFGNEAKWIGTMHAIFIDPKGFLREDSDDDDRLDGYDVDKVISIFFDPDERRARVRRYSSSSASEFIESSSTVGELESLIPIWNARQQLSGMTDAQALNQRPYESSADTGRYITTWLDADYDGLVGSDEQVAFVPSTFDAANFGWLDVHDGTTPYTPTEAQKLVEYIRGVDQDGYRSRQLDYEKDGSVQTMRLGDIVNSTPTVQGAPSESFDILSLDASYGEFRAKYRNRRNVVYVGANDGMIHAFNSGFFDVQTREFKTQMSGETAHPLGSELWAYIPKNLLGHLQWLKEQEYTHVFYADLKPLVFDAKIFADDATHPEGWGTVLVVGMRLGGGNDINGITLDTQADGYGALNTLPAAADEIDDIKTKSAYVVLDVTDPEQPPRLIAELAPETQYYTTPYPSAVVIGERSPNGSTIAGPNEWYLMFGSGPTGLGTVESTQTARIFAYDLNDLAAGLDGLVTSGPFTDGYADTGEANSFVGEMTTSDQDLDLKAEAVYFGTIGTADGIGGNLYRMTLAELPTPTSVSTDPANNGWGSPFKLLDVDQPFTARPSITLDIKGNTWILAGSGRLFTNNDKESTAVQTLYGFIDPNNLMDASANTPVNDANLMDVTDAITYTDGSVDEDGDGTIDSTFKAMTADVESAGGWKLNYAFDGITPAERTLSNQALIGGIVLSSAFTPTNDLCGAEGESRIIGRAFNSGLVPPQGVFGTEPCGGACPDESISAVAIGSEELGAGLASSPSIHIGNQEVPGKVTVIVQQSTGAITGNKAQTMGGLNNGEVSWQEFRSE